MLRQQRWLATAAVVWIAGGPWVGPARADDVQVNTYTTGNQSGPSVASDADGDFVVVWSSDGSSGSDSSSTSIQGQRHDPTGSMVGGEFQVNTYTTERQTRPAVAMDADGDAVVVWDSRGSGGTDSSSTSIQGRRYASDGTRIGDEFQVNTYTAGAQYDPSVALDADGDFVVIWTSLGSEGTDTSGASIQGRRYASDGTPDGTPDGSDFQVNTYTTDRQAYPSVSISEAGEFVVVWQRVYFEYSPRNIASPSYISYAVQSQRYAADGTPVGEEFRVSPEGFEPTYPSVALDALGNFIVVWHDYPSDEWILGRRYASDGNAVGEQFQVNTYTTSSNHPAVAMDADGDFVVVWQSWGMNDEDPSEWSVIGQRFRSSGTPWGSRFQINTYTTGQQADASVSIADGGEFVVVWRSDGSGGTDQDGSSVQRSAVEIVVVKLIFADGFESGDTSSWSSTTTP